MPWIRGLQVHRSTHPSLAARSHTTATFRGTPSAPRQAPALLLPESNLQVSAQCFPSPCTQTLPLPESGGAAALAGSGVGEGPESRVVVALHSNRRVGGMGGEGEGAVVEYDLYSVLRPVSGAKPDGS